MKIMSNYNNNEMMLEQQHQIAQLTAERDELLAALTRAERKLTAYVGVCTGDKELTDAVLPMARGAIASAIGE
jgi:transcriptional regulator GlxA family with amidase domain